MPDGQFSVRPSIPCGTGIYGRRPLVFKVLTGVRTRYYYSSGLARAWHNKSHANGWYALSGASLSLVVKSLQPRLRDATRESLEGRAGAWRTRFLFVCEECTRPPHRRRPRDARCGFSETVSEPSGRARPRISASAPAATPRTPRIPTHAPGDERGILPGSLRRPPPASRRPPSPSPRRPRQTPEQSPPNGNRGSAVRRRPPGARP